MRGETHRRVYRRGVTLALAQIQFGQRQDGGIDMMAMADMMVVVVLVIAMFENCMVMPRMCAGVQIVIMEMRPDGMCITAQVNMHRHRRRPGKLKRDDKQENQNDQTTHAPDANPARSPGKPRRAGANRPSRITLFARLAAARRIHTRRTNRSL